MTYIPFDKNKSKEKKRLLINEGETKNLLDDQKSPHLILQFKDDFVQKNTLTLTNLSNSNIIKKAQIPGKGIINNRTSGYFFQLLQDRGIDTHYIDVHAMYEQKVKPSIHIPFEVTYHNIADKHLANLFSLTEGKHLPAPFIEFNREIDYNMSAYPVSEDHLIQLQLTTKDELQKIKSIAQRANDFLSGLLLSKGFRLYNIKLSFGYLDDEDFPFQETSLLITDEISLETMTLEDSVNNKMFSKQSLEKHHYEEFFKRVIEK